MVETKDDDSHLLIRIVIQIFLKLSIKPNAIPQRKMVGDAAVGVSSSSNRSQARFIQGTTAVVGRLEHGIILLAGNIAVTRSDQDFYVDLNRIQRTSRTVLLPAISRLSFLPARLPRPDDGSQRRSAHRAPMQTAYSSLSSSTSKMSVAFGGMAPGWPREP